MYRSNYLTTILFIFMFVFHGVNSVDTATVSITAAAAYAVEPACVQSCVFYNSFDVADYLVVQLGCTRSVHSVLKGVSLFTVI